jgi:hypothetical protein
VFTQTKVSASDKTNQPIPLQIALKVLMGTVANEDGRFYPELQTYTTIVITWFDKEITLERLIIILDSVK